MTCQGRAGDFAPDIQGTQGNKGRQIMFRKVTGDKEDESKRCEDGISAPPLRPFSKKGSHSPVKMSSSHSPRPEVSRHAAEIPSAPRIPERRRFADGDPKCLIVGRDICLNGEITSCDRLVVEGEVDVILSDARDIEITSHGHFKGEATVETAEVSGRFDGKLIARERLTVRSGGTVCGTIRYACIVIEPGGEISGDTQSLTGDDIPANADNEEKNTDAPTIKKS